MRASHFKFGDYATPYNTTARDQNLGALGGKPAQLDADVKADLRRSHFTMGSNDPTLKTEYQDEYIKKPSMEQPKMTNDLRSTNYVLGSDNPDYLTEHQDRFKKPPLQKNDANISTAELQKSHYHFGSDKAPWMSTQNHDYVPKPLSEPYPYGKDLAKTNFKFGDDDPTKSTIYRDTYVKKPINPAGLDKELVTDLRRHHFGLGNVPYGDELNTIYLQDYTPQDLKANPPLDDRLLRGSHWDIGEKVPFTGNYDTTYNVTHTPKKRIESAKIPKHKSNIAWSGPGQWETEFKANYIPMKAEGNPFMGDLVKDIKNAHWGLGDNIPDYTTTFGDAYKYDPNAALKARGNLGKGLVDDLKKTHYKLGYGDPINKSTYEANYIPLGMESTLGKDPNLFRNNIPFGELPFQGDTTYRVEYIPKPLPDIYDC